MKRGIDVVDALLDTDRVKLEIARNGQVHEAKFFAFNHTKRQVIMGDVGNKTFVADGSEMGAMLALVMAGSSSGIDFPDSMHWEYDDVGVGHTAGNAAGDTIGYEDIAPLLRDYMHPGACCRFIDLLPPLPGWFCNV